MCEREERETHLLVKVEQLLDVEVALGVGAVEEPGLVLLGLQRRVRGVRALAADRVPEAGALLALKPELPIGHTIGPKPHQGLALGTGSIIPHYII